MKKIIRILCDKQFRFEVLAARGLYDWMSDELFLKRAFFLRMGRKLNLQDPKSFSEKMQWLKINNRRIEYTAMADKYYAKKYVSSILGEEYIIPTLGVWNKFDDINFSKLPDKFVLKCTHDSGGLVICKNRNLFDRLKAKEKINNCFKKKYYRRSREWPYKNIKPRIIAEQFIDNGTQPLRDYKFFNFNAETKFVYVSEGLEDHSTAKISFLDLEGNLMGFHRTDYLEFPQTPKLPDNFSEMVKLSNKLSKSIGSPFVRIDFYSINNKIYFSEITFYPCGGMMPITPFEWEIKLGEMLELKYEEVY